MPSTHTPIKGIPLTIQPGGLSRCGMSNATFAMHRTSKRWYEISVNGKIIGSPLELDFYRYDNYQVPETRSNVRAQELTKV